MQKIAQAFWGEPRVLGADVRKSRVTDARPLYQNMPPILRPGTGVPPGRVGCQAPIVRCLFQLSVVSQTLGGLKFSTSPCADRLLLGILGRGRLLFAWL